MSANVRPAELPDENVVIPLGGKVGLPAPPVPRDASLSGYDYMPLYIKRLKRSASWRLTRRYPALGTYMINLWTFAFEEEPPGSIENDDEALADAAECSLETWHGPASDKEPDGPTVRELVLRGWTACSDGRLYHAFLSELVIELLGTRRKKSTAGRAGAAARWPNNEADPQPELPDCRPPGDGRIAVACDRIAVACDRIAIEREGERDTEREENPSGFSDEKPSGEGVARERATDHPPPEAICQEWILEAAELRAKHELPIAALPYQAERFLNWHGARKTRLVDWHGEWLNWALDAKAAPPEVAAAVAKFGVPPPETGPPQPVDHRLGEPGDRLQAQLGPGDFRRWFAGVEAAIDADGTVTLLTSGGFTAKRLRDDFGPQIAAAWPGRRVEIVARPKALAEAG